ncbi:hypothetical protein ISN45_At04g026660 [Arabidopsis thaliana x Arabidopsis arenosa]|uniref:Uncharacterized protein n=2 Tax=Arabidopsis TaxID=3701 RepID=A0A8T2EEB9_ARASU|nr:hypothetical protein ISN45_At04g026660 [Arabidopsis thaliana x Arabidopsis arenosa]KAG7621749.1 hypothetical protein ISN44_As04g026170 [Arabidopsis suecica]
MRKLKFKFRRSQNIYPDNETGTGLDPREDLNARLLLRGFLIDNK